MNNPIKYFIYIDQFILLSRKRNRKINFRKTTTTTKRYKTPENNSKKCIDLDFKDVIMAHLDHRILCEKSSFGPIEMPFIWVLVFGGNHFTYC